MRENFFSRLYESHAEALFSFLAYRTGDRVLAEDLVAETFERALRARRRFDPRRSSERTWLYAIALNCARDAMRRRGAEARAMQRVSVPDTGGEWLATEERLDLRQALETLTEEEREAVALRYGSGLTVPEIASVTGQSLTTAEGRVYRALRKLRSVLEGED